MTNPNTKKLLNLTRSNTVYLISTWDDMIIDILYIVTINLQLFGFRRV